MNATPFAALSPDVVLDAVAALGFEPDGRLLALNSFENRVYQVGIEDSTPLIAKFYRPGRWSDAAIREEHAFSFELVAAELPVVAPLVIDGDSLLEFDGQRIALFPRRGGRAPDLEGSEVAAWLGRLIARIHNVGAQRKFSARGVVDVASRVRGGAAHVLASQLMPAYQQARYRALIEQIATQLDGTFANAQARAIRLHGDCHPGNLLWTDQGPHFVDLDDAAMGPAIQDLWMLFDGTPAQRAALLEGYGEFRDLDYAELALVEPLRIMRQIHHAGWIAARYADPAFPAAFPFAAEARWWEEHCNDLARWLEQD
jgi:Ser/Thr protein kinase RdoA (MazF antagonist)